MIDGLKILYFSCHEVLEYDDLRIFNAAGHSVFSLGAYSEPGSEGFYRKPKPEFFNQDDWLAYNASSCSSDGYDYIDPEFAARFDIAIVNSVVDWAFPVVEAMRGRPVVYRSLGQSTESTERELIPLRDKIKIVRYAEGEANLPGFLDTDAVIHFGKFLSDFAEPWRGTGGITTFHNEYYSRSLDSTPSVEDYERLMKGRNFELWGSGNENISGSRGVASADDQISIYLDSSIYFYVPTIPPSYTLSFMEAMGAGVPIVTPSADLVEKSVSEEARLETSFLPQRYNVPNLLNNDSNLIYNSLYEAAEKLDILTSNEVLRKSISHNMKQSFAENFNASSIADQWNEFFKDIIRE